MSVSPHNDDGKVIRAKRGRPAKPDLTEAERQAIAGLGEQQAAAKVSDMRGANLGSITAAEASRRRVSHDWVRRQILRKTHPTQNSVAAPSAGITKNAIGANDTGARIMRDAPPGAATRKTIDGENGRVPEGALLLPSDGEVAKQPEGSA